REGDPELRRRQVRRRVLECGDREGEPRLPAGLARLEVCAVEIDEGELAGDEDARADDEDEAHAQHDPVPPRSVTPAFGSWLTRERGSWDAGLRLGGSSMITRS